MFERRVVWVLIVLGVVALGVIGKTFLTETLDFQQRQTSTLEEVMKDL